MEQLTEDGINGLIDTLAGLRTAAFKQGNEEIYKLLGKGMGALMDVRLILRTKVESGS